MLKLIKNPEVKGIVGLATFILILVVILLAASGTLTDWTGIRFTLKKPLTNSIVFVSDRGGKTDIWAMNPDGSNLRQLTNDAAVELNPVVSPDGYSIAFISKRASTHEQLYMIDSDGNNLRQISNITGAKTAPRFSADGKEIVFICTGDIWRIGARGDNPERLLPPGELASMPEASQQKIPFYWAAKSADGKVLAGIQSQEETQFVSWIAEGDKGPQPVAQQTPQGFIVLSGELVNAAWDHSSEKLALTLTDRKNEGVLVTANKEDGSITPILMKSSAIGSPVWSPDDNSIAVEILKRKNAGDYDSIGLKIVDSTGSPRVLVKGKAKSPTWSPDGKTILFTRGNDIFSVNVETGKAVNLTKGKGNNSAPSWAPLVTKK